MNSANSTTSGLSVGSVIFKSMQSFLKKAARIALHQMGGLAVLRRWHRSEFAVLMFHSFSEADRANVEAICSYISRHFEPVSLSDIVDSIQQGKELPENAIAITIDDGYRNFLLHGHPIFRRYRINTTMYAVTGFSDGRLWLWPDQIEFGLLHTPNEFIRVIVNGEALGLPLTNPQDRTESGSLLLESLKTIPNQQRIHFMETFSALCRVEIPPQPPADRSAMSWEDLRAVTEEGVEIGCHTESHPIVSRLTDPIDLDREIRGAKQEMEERLGIPVRHFCYPNGRAIDVGQAAIRCVRESGYDSAVTCTWGLNTLERDRFQIRRTPFDSSVDFRYGIELLAGLHMQQSSAKSDGQ